MGNFWGLLICTWIFCGCQVFNLILYSSLGNFRNFYVIYKNRIFLGPWKPLSGTVQGWNMRLPEVATWSQPVTFLAEVGTELAFKKVITQFQSAWSPINMVFSKGKEKWCAYQKERNISWHLKPRSSKQFFSLVAVNENNFHYK